MESLFSDAALPFRSKCLSDKLPKPMRLHLSLFQKLPWRILWNKALAGFLDVEKGQQLLGDGVVRQQASVVKLLIFR